MLNTSRTISDCSGALHDIDLVLNHLVAQHAQLPRWLDALTGSWRESPTALRFLCRETPQSHPVADLGLYCLATSFVAPDFVSFTASSFLPCEFQDSLDTARTYAIASAVTTSSSCSTACQGFGTSPFGKQKARKETEVIA